MTQNCYNQVPKPFTFVEKRSFSSFYNLAGQPLFMSESSSDLPGCAIQKLFIGQENTAQLGGSYSKIRGNMMFF